MLISFYIGKGDKELPRTVVTVTEAVNFQIVQSLIQDSSLKASHDHGSQQVQKILEYLTFDQQWTNRQIDRQ